jgi:hypothetical protein
MTVNQQTVEETKQQIRVLVNEIASLGKAGTPAEEYYPQFLQRVITALAAVGGAVWLLDEDRNLRLQYQINMSESLREEEGEDAKRHTRLMRRVAGTGQSLLVPPYSGTADSEAEGNPTKYLLVLAPLSHDKKVDGLIEVFQRPDAAPATQQGYLRFLQQMAELAAEWLRNERLAHFSDRQVLWQQADTFARACHESLDLKETAYIVANEGRRLIGCDRVSVAILKGRKCKVQSISGQDTIENRSNIVAALNKLATRVVAAGEPLWHDGKTEDLPPQIEEALEEYVDQSYGRHIAVLPLREPVRDSSNEPTGAAGEIDRDGSHRGETIGALIVEQIESNLPADVFHNRVNLVYEHGTRAIANSLHYDSLFLMPIWRSLGRISWIIKARTLPKTLAITGLILALLLALIFVPWEMELEANGTLEPDSSRHVFAPIDGIVQLGIPDYARRDADGRFRDDEGNVFVEVIDGLKVDAGDVLLVLENRELELKITELQGQLNRTQEELGSVQSQLSRGNFDPIESRKLQGEELSLVSQLETLKESLNLRLEQRRSLKVRAPISGVVTTWDLVKTLNKRPVVTGQVLIDIANLNEPMHLRIRMPDKRMHHLDQRLNQLASGEMESRTLPVDFILATEPDRTRTATLDVTSIERRTTSDKDDGEVVRMKAYPDADSLSDFEVRPGAKVIADVHVGKRPLGYVLGYEVYEWLCKFFF